MTRLPTAVEPRMYADERGSISTGDSVRRRGQETEPARILKRLPRALERATGTTYDRVTTPRTSAFIRGSLAALAALSLAPAPAAAQWVSQHETYYLQAPHNWEFRNRYQAADRLFNAFDYGHAILYEKLWTEPDAPPAILEEKEYDFLTKRVLVRPPRVPLEEAAIEIRYVQLAPEAKLMFEWAHILHRQMYDVLADESLSESAKDAEVARLLAYYRTRPDLAFSARPKSMALMQEQPYSLAFRKEYPKFNGLIWAYHWLQVGLYEPLLVGRTSDERQAGVRATVARFWQMLGDAPRTMPHQMPMTAAISPRFTERYPEAAIIFDNLHSMHDVISDILANDAVPRSAKRAEILRAARLFRDDTSYVMTVEGWKAMAGHMGLENMGGPAVGFLPELPAPTVTYGAVMTHDDRTGAMTGFTYGSAVGGAHAGHAAADTAARPAAAADPHAGHGQPPAAAPADTGHAMHGGTPGAMPGGMMHDSAHMAGMMAMHMRMMEDSVIRRRMMADTAMRRMMQEMMEHMPAEHRARMQELMARDSAAATVPVRKDTPPAPRPAVRQPARRAAPAAKPAPKPAAKPADPHAGHTPPPAPRKPPADPHAGHRPPAS